MQSAFGVEHGQISKAKEFDTHLHREAKKMIEEYHRNRLTGGYVPRPGTKAKVVEQAAKKSGKFKALAIGGAAATAAGAGGYAYAHRKKSA